jgi:membrane protease YdiL (CAAX protease family)
MMPILGLNWISALIIGTIFGVLHLGNGRKYSFAIWYILFCSIFACVQQEKDVLFPAIHISVNMVIRFRYILIHIFFSRATFVGFAYGIGTIASSSIIVPMASHSINNIIGGLLWRYTKNSQK